MPSLTGIEEIQLRVMSDLQHMFTELRQYQQRHDLVRELDTAILRSTFSAQHVLDLIIEKCLHHAGADHGQVILYRDGRLIVAASTNRDRAGEEVPLHGSLSGKAITERVDQHCYDLSALPEGSYVRYHDTTKSELVVLIRPANESRVLGVIDLERNVTGNFSESALGFAHLLAGEAAVAIEHARIASGIKTLYEISNAVASDELSLQQTYNAILSALLAKSGFEHGQILIRDGDTLVIVASSRPEDIGLRVGPESSVCGQYLLVEQAHHVLVINDIASSSYRDVYLNLLGTDGRPMRSELVVPLFNESNLTIGALNIESPELGVFSAIDETFFGVVGNLLAGAILAALARQKRLRDEQIKTAGLAMTQLGNVAQSFLHRFGSAIGDTRVRLMELRQYLSEQDLPPVPGTTSLDEFIVGMIDNLTGTAETLIEFNSRFNPGGAEFMFRNVDLAATGKGIVQKYQRKYAKSDIDFVFDNQLRTVMREGKTPVFSKAICRLTDKVDEVIENLMDNAVRAVEERLQGAEKGRITLTILLDDSLHARLRVTDNGVGISTKDQLRIFDFGYTTRKKGGASRGIGLWFCQQYTFQVGGNLRFHSIEGEGSWFEVEFPTVET